MSTKDTILQLLLRDAFYLKTAINSYDFRFTTVASHSVQSDVDILNFLSTAKMSKIEVAISHAWSVLKIVHV